MSSVRRTVAPALVAACVVLLAGCGDETRATVRDSSVVNVDAGGGAAARPTAVPAAAGVVRTVRPVTVLDSGTGAQLCAGPVAESMPPQCSGVPLAGWDWAEQAHQSTAGTRWSDTVVLTGRFDGTTFTVASVERVVPDLDDRVVAARLTPCPEPSGGWQVENTSRVSADNLDRARRRAAEETGFVESWVDVGGVDADGLGGAFDPAAAILNVATTGDVPRTERKLRAVWGGKMCVTRAASGRTAADLDEIAADLADLPGAVGVTPSLRTGRVDLEVVHDDGTVQRWADTQYGRGAVLVVSVLVPDEE